jgi:cardiolipin synthase
MAFFDTGPGRSRSRAGAIFRRLLGAARQTIWVSMAYFLPIGGVLRAFLAAARRGVTIRVITPGESDVPLVQFATRHLHDRLLRRHIRLYERQGRMLHSKVLVVDDEWSLVGSSNLDPRSLNINLELIAVIRSKELARTLVAIARYELAHSERITGRTARQRGWWERLTNRLAWAVRWWL